MFANQKQLLYKVKPVKTDTIAIGGENSEFTLPNKSSRFYSADRRVLLVRHAFPGRKVRKGGELKNIDPSPQDSRKGDYFYIDVPKHFFATKTTDGAELGDFIANPPYKETDILVVQWTGFGKYSGWIDTNVQMRGAGIGTVIEQGGVACAKWS